MTYSAHIRNRLRSTDTSPCPFCDGVRLELRSWTEPATKSTGDSVICMDCGAMGPMAHDPDEAIDEWNTRRCRARGRHT